VLQHERRRGILEERGALTTAQSRNAAFLEATDTTVQRISVDVTFINEWRGFAFNGYVTGGNGSAGSGISSDNGGSRGRWYGVSQSFPKPLLTPRKYVRRGSQVRS